MRLIPSDFASLTQTIVSLLEAHPERPVLVEKCRNPCYNDTIH